MDISTASNINSNKHNNTNNTTNSNNDDSIANHTSVTANSTQTNERTKLNEDNFNTLTFEECERHFIDHYETNVEQFAETKDKLSLLRSCVELLNRLEGSCHNAFAGRVLIFLAKVIPFFDQSGVNLRSECSVKELPKSVKQTLQHLSSRKAEKTKQLSQGDIEEGETLSDESNDCAPQEDIEKVFERFWKTQQLLSQPNLLYDKNIWSTFRGNIEMLLHKFDSRPAQVNLWSLDKDFMTEPRTLALQMNDVNFRRCVMVQILIVLQYFELPVETRPENFVLDKVQLTWSATIIRKIYALLESMPNREEGSRFLGMVQHVLRDEELWNQWKNEKCKEPKKIEEDDEVPNMRSTYHKKRKIGDEMGAAKSYNMQVIGSQEMSRLWNKESIQKYSTPDLTEYLNIAPEKQNEYFKDPNHSFRVLRLLRRSPHFFAPSSTVIQSLDEYLKAAVIRYLG